MANDDITRKSVSEKIEMIERTEEGLRKRKVMLEKIDLYAQFFQCHQGEGHELVPFDNPTAMTCGYVCDCGDSIEMLLGDIKKELKLSPDDKLERLLINKGW